MSREVLLQQPLKLQDRYIIEREHIDQNFQAIARSPCSYEGHVTSLSKDHVYVVRRKNHGYVLKPMDIKINCDLS